MNRARIVVLTIAVGAGGVAAYLASGSDPQVPTVQQPTVQLQTVDVLVAKNDIGLGHSVTADDGRPGVGAEGRRERRLLDVERRQLEMWRDSRTTHDQGEKQGETNPC